MKVEFVNHSSFVTEVGAMRLLADPWLEGTAFNDGWALVTPSRFSPRDFDGITHLWFSHEHPDHFSPLTLKRIPTAAMARMTVLFQETRDKKVVEFCRKLGFARVVELPDSRPYEEIPGVRLICGRMPNDGDSWLSIQGEGRSILNLNDCTFTRPGSRLDKVVSLTGRPDVLFTQFSYANWVGNRGDVASHRRHAAEKLAELDLQVSIVRPRWVVPFASFVWFCHEDNFFMNASVNRLEDVVARLRNGPSRPVVLYPGDVWVIDGPEPDSARSLARYTEDWERAVAGGPALRSPRVELDALEKSAEGFRHRCLQANNRRKLRSFAPFSFFLTDHRAAFEFSFRDGMRQAALTAESCDVALTAQALQFGFDFNWGFDTLLVSGRFEKPAQGKFRRLEEYHWVASLNNVGRRLPGIFGRAALRARQIFGA